MRDLIFIKIIALSFFMALPLFAYELTIHEAINLGLYNSSELKISEADLNAARNKQISSWLSMGPKISASYNHNFFGNSVKIPMNNTEVLMRGSVTSQGSLVLTQPITSLFGIIGKARIDSKQKNIKESALKASRSKIAFKIAESYLLAQQSERMKQIAEASIELSESQKRDGLALLKAERIHRGDYLKLELALSQALLAKAKAKAAQESAYFNLSELIGFKDPSALLLTPLEHDEISLAELPLLEEAFDKALLNRQEIKQALLGQEIAQITKMSSLVKFLPSINFFAQIDRNFAQKSFMAPQENKFLGFNLSWDLFNSGAHFFEARESAHIATKALYQSETVKKAIRLELMHILSSLKAAGEVLALAHKAVEQAHESYRIEKLQFLSGKSGASELVLAETAKTQADGNLTSVSADLKIQKLKLQQALGELAPAL